MKSTSDNPKHKVDESLCFGQKPAADQESTFACLNRYCEGYIKIPEARDVLSRIIGIQKAPQPNRYDREKIYACIFKCPCCAEPYWLHAAESYVRKLRERLKTIPQNP